MVLHLETVETELTLWGEVSGRRLATSSLLEALHPLFFGWKEPILTGRGVLHVLQGCLRGRQVRTVTYGEDLLTWAEALEPAVRLVVAGYVVPIVAAGEARWRATRLPDGVAQDKVQWLVDLWMRTTGSTTLSRRLAERGQFYTYHDAWLAAQRAPVAALSLRPGEVGSMEDFTAEVAAWASPAFTGGRKACELVLTLTEAGGTIAMGDGSPEALVQLGQAIAVAPLLAQPQPWEPLTVERFLRDAVPALRAAAFTVVLPEGLEEMVPEVIEVAEGMTDEGIVLRQTISFGGIELSVAEAQAILDGGQSLIYLNDSWRYINLEKLRVLLDQMGPGIRSKHLSVPLLLAGAWRISPEAQDVQNFLRELTSPPEGELPLREILRPYQAQGVCWMMQAAAHGLGVCLADDMGLGKTIQTIAFILSRKTPTLVVAPLTVLPVWEHELKTFAPGLRVLRHEGAERLLEESFVAAAAEKDVVLTAYGNLWRDYATLRRISWETVVLDEAQQIKNPGTRQSQAARSLTAKMRIALTGTPIENRLDDLWSILDFLNPELFGTRRDFVERYTDPERLKKAVSHFLLRRLKRDPGILSELPPKIVQEHYAPLSSVQSAAYDLALAEYARVAKASPTAASGRMLALLTQLKQLCDSPNLDVEEGEWEPEESGKVMTLLPLIDEILGQGESVLIFTQFARMGLRLKHLLSERLEREVPFVYGTLTAKQRKEQLALFNDDERPSVLLLSLKTGAFGLTLTKANHVVHLDRWWNPAVEAQATDRVHRMGQKRTVVVHHLICRGTLEDSIDRLLREKRDLAESIVAPTPAALLAKLPMDTLVSLLQRQSV